MTIPGNGELGQGLRVPAPRDLRFSMSAPHWKPDRGNLGDETSGTAWAPGRVTSQHRLLVPSCPEGWGKVGARGQGRGQGGGGSIRPWLLAPEGGPAPVIGTCGLVRESVAAVQPSLPVTMAGPGLEERERGRVSLVLQTRHWGMDGQAADEQEVDRGKERRMQAQKAPFT